MVAFISSMIGTGGGVFYVPMLLSIGTEIDNALTVSLLLTFVTGLSSMVYYMKARFVDYKLAFILLPATICGAILSSHFSQYIDKDVMRTVLGGILVFCGTMIILTSGSSKMRPDNAAPSCIASGAFDWRRFAWHGQCGDGEYSIPMFIALPAQLINGCLIGLGGIGGGVVNVPLMILVFRMPVKLAVGTSAFMIPLATIFAFSKRASQGEFVLSDNLGVLSPAVLAVLIIALIAGAQAGPRLTVATAKNMLRRIFGTVLVLIALWIIFRANFLNG